MVHERAYPGCTSSLAAVLTRMVEPWPKFHRCPYQNPPMACSPKWRTSSHARSNGQDFRAFPAVMANLVTYHEACRRTARRLAARNSMMRQLCASRFFPPPAAKKLLARLFDPRDRRLPELTRWVSMIRRCRGISKSAQPRTSGSVLSHWPDRFRQDEAQCIRRCVTSWQRDGTAISISTVEDPVEFNLPMVSQTQINPAQQFTYAVALKSIFAARDPQVIMVGKTGMPKLRPSRRAGGVDRASGHQHDSLRRFRRRVHAADQHGDRAVHACVQHPGCPQAAAGAPGLPGIACSLMNRSRAS